MRKLSKSIKSIFYFSIIITMFAMMLPQTIVKAETHTHSIDCYPQGASMHVHSGSETEKGECFTVNESEHNCGGIITWQSIGSSTAKCPKCGEKISIDYYSGTSDKCGQRYSSTYYNRCSNCNYKITQVNTNAKISYPSTECKYTISSTAKYTCTCGKEEGKVYDASGNEVKTTCSTVVTSIAPAYPTQVSSNPNFTLIATYLDGHTAYVQPTSTDYDATKTYNNATITLSYTGEITSVGNIGTISTTCAVTKSAGMVVQDGVIVDVGVSETTTATQVTPTLAPTIVVTEIPMPTPTPRPTRTPTTTNTSSGGSSSSGATTSGGTYNTNKYPNSTTNTGTSADNSVKEDDVPEVGVAEVTEAETIERQREEIIFSSIKEVMPTSAYGILHFSENVRGEVNDTKGTAPTETPTPTPFNESYNETTYTPPTQTQKSVNTKAIMIYAILIIALVAIIIVGIMMAIKNKKKHDDIKPQHMSLQDRLNS